MFRKAWQSSMIGLARSKRAKSFMQNSRATSFLRDKYVAGVTSSDGVDRAVQLLNSEGIRSSLFYMGEYVDDLDLVADNVSSKLDVTDKLSEQGLDIYVSVDPTQIGHHVDPEIVSKNAETIAERIKQAIGNKGGVNCLMFDMEDARLNDPTIGLHNNLQDDGYPVALTLQAYMRRTYADMEAQVARGSTVRLVKGAFAAGADLAFQTQPEIKKNSRRLIDLMLSQEAKRSGFYPIIATHDTKLHDYTIAKAKANGWTTDQYEFEMLLGVREDVARNLAKKGQRVRLYVPFGRDWWPHAVRRIGENPRNAILLARSLVQ